MIVYIESNFILEIVRKQKYALSTEAVLQLAEQGKIELVYPSFALCEPFATITQRERELKRLGKFVEGAIDGLSTLLSDAATKEKNSLWLILTRLIAAGTASETNSPCFTEALACQKRFQLSQQDSIMYAAIITDLQQRPHEILKCFLDSNFKDFRKPAIIAELNSYNCYYEENFTKGLNYIKYHIERGS